MDPPNQAQDPPFEGSKGIERITPDRSTAAGQTFKPFLCRRPVRLTIYTGFALLGLFMLAWGYLPIILDPTFEKHIQDKRVVAGMTREQALQAWGSPYQMNVTYTDKGIRREEWVFEDWKDAGTVSHRYLYFEEGILAGGWYYE
ncbi:MAG: hypothetical protein ACE1ZE_04520 [Candidatus Binatia bacterium]